MSPILAIDLGGTRCRIGLADSANPAEVALVEDRPAPSDRADFLNCIRVQLEAHGAKALGLGIPGLAQGTVCRWVPNLPFLDGLDLAAEFPGVSIGLGNDAQLSLLAEVHAGVAEGQSDALLLAIGTGIGSAVLASGMIIAGQGGGACSYGWATADISDAGEDVSGWLERQAAGRAYDQIAHSIGFENGHALMAAARSGDPKALSALHAPVEALGTATAAAVALLDPALIIIAGGVAEACDILEPLLRPAIDRRLPPHLRGVPIKPARYRSQAGLIGAAFAGASGPNWRRTS
ncbi:MAG: ROK family protein [Devosia sp.]|uniref:ROK family protein n=1 Tax=unclassified Devosia TaxID=196773 RepID=UPI001A01B5D8|nr:MULTISPECIES: ROK family protein [unclassified Devosia]MBF0679870.1 ROK family protein [Devosia sp.]WEJ34593.1 ROK family protein [Devosia sp. SD17-2]